MAINLNNQNKSHYRPMAEINVTPMVDVMLVLLIIFMITSPMIVSGIKVDLPESAAKEISDSQKPLSITITNENKIYINDHKINSDELVEKIKAITNENTQTTIYIRGDKNINYGNVMKVVGKINKAGFSKVALVTEFETIRN